MGQGGGREEGNLVVTPAASLRPSAERKGALVGTGRGALPHAGMGRAAGALGWSAVGWRSAFAGEAIWLSG